MSPFLPGVTPCATPTLTAATAAATMIAAFLHIRRHAGRDPVRAMRDAPPIAGTDTELALIMLAAMLSPTTLSFSVLTLVLADRPLRAGSWFYAGAFTATLAVGIVAAFVL